MLFIKTTIKKFIQLEMKKIKYFRFDDVCINADIDLINKMNGNLLDYARKLDIMLQEDHLNYLNILLIFIIQIQLFPMRIDSIVKVMYITIQGLHFLIIVNLDIDGLMELLVIIE